jgi:hypothetical protein
MLEDILASGFLSDAAQQSACAAIMITNNEEKIPT